MTSKKGKVSYILLNKNNIHLLKKLEKEAEKTSYRNFENQLREVTGERYLDKVIIQLYEGKPAGYFEITHHKAKSGKGINEIAWMYVKDEYKGKGLSRKMYKEALRISQIEGIPIFANPIANKRAERAAENLGKMIKAQAEKRKKQSQKDKAKKIRR